MTPTSGGQRTAFQSVRVERDADGKIVRVLRKDNPLNDPLNALDSDNSENEEDEEEEAEAWGGIDEDEDEEGDTQTEIVRQLEAEANRPRVKRARTLSRREREWIERLVQRHGDDVRAMAWDRALNPMQQTEADIARRIRKWKGEEAS